MDFETTIIVGPTDTDSYNIIHHPQYFIWIEKVILEWLISTYGNIDGLTYEINKFQCKFLSPGVLNDKLTLRLRYKGKKALSDRACLKFQVSIANQTTRHPVIEADFFVKVSGKIAWLA